MKTTLLRGINQTPDTGLATGGLGRQNFVAFKGITTFSDIIVSL
jgi:hypothetical protein